MSYKNNQSKSRQMINDIVKDSYRMEHGILSDLLQIGDSKRRYYLGGTLFK